MATLAQPVVSAPHPDLSQLDLAAVEAGVPLETMMNFLEAAGLELKDIYDVVIPARTLTHRRARNESLSREESEKLARLIRIYDHSLRVFGAVPKVLKFLRRPKQRFDGRTPLNLIRTELGGTMVDGMLWQIADGMFV